MSAIKNSNQAFFEEEHLDFVTDDKYNDFLQMQKEHMDEELILQHEGSQTNINWEKQANEFLASSKAPVFNDDLPF